MSANAETRPVPQGAPPKRRLRNYLLDPRFQLKYTGMVVLVTVAVASVLGWFAYDHSKGQTESMTLTIAMQPDLNPDAAADLEGWAQAEDKKVLMSIVLGILALAITLAFTGIMVTHKLVGPAYKMRLLLNQVSDGKLKLQGRLRKGDELQELFEAFANMVESLREAQAREVAELDAAIAHAKESGIDAGDLRAIQEVRDRMSAALD